MPTRVEDGEEDEPAATEERARNREAGEYALPAAHVGKQATEGANDLLSAGQGGATGTRSLFPHAA